MSPLLAIAWVAASARPAPLLATPVEVPLLRGPVGDFLPQVEGTTGDHTVLVTLDVAGERTRVGRQLAGALGLRERRGSAVLDLRIGALELPGLAAEVVVAEGLILGVAGLDDLATALLASRGVVRFAPPGSGLLASVGVPLERVEGSRRWREHGVATSGRERVWVAPAELGGTAGLVRLDTARPRSAVERRAAPGAAPGGREPLEVGLGGGVVSITPRVASVGRSPHAELLGTLGMDALYRYDLAVEPATGRLALALVDPVPPANPAPVAAALARALRPEPEPVDPYAVSVPEGDLGDPARAAQLGWLAEALAAAGEGTAALEVARGAALEAGDRCLAHARVARIARSVPEADLERDLALPLEQVAALWEAWARRTPRERERARRGRDRTPGALWVPQSDGCAEVVAPPPSELARAAELGRAGRGSALLAQVGRIRAEGDAHPLLVALVLDEAGRAAGVDALEAWASGSEWAVAARVARGASEPGALELLAARWPHDPRVRALRLLSVGPEAAGSPSGLLHPDVLAASAERAHRAGHADALHASWSALQRRFPELPLPNRWTEATHRGAVGQ